MEWFIAYLISVIVVSNLITVVIHGRRGDNDKVHINNGEQLFLVNLFCLFWFITLPIYGFRCAARARREAITEKAKSILRSYSFTSTHDRSFILEVPEWQLKYIFRAYRNKLVELNAPTIEMIREELMSRNMERNLLK